MKPNTPSSVFPAPEATTMAFQACNWSQTDGRFDWFLDIQKSQAGFDGRIERVWSRAW